MMLPNKIVLPCSEGSLELDTVANKKILHIFRAVNHGLRLKIIELIASRPNIIVTDIYQQLVLPQAIASQHLKVLRTAGILQTKKKGKFVYYNINEVKLKKIIDITSML